MSEKQPNFLIVMADQMAAPALPVYGHPVVKAPNLASLAEEGVVFENAYCPSPLCAPSRASVLAGQLPSRIGTYDNASEFPASVPTFGHYLRVLGYQTSLAGKMNFIGPDQLHGFEERLTTDIYPADFTWTPDWEQPEQRFSWYHNMLSVVQAGVCETSNQLDYDEEVAFYAVRKLYELAREPDGRPFCLLVSFTHPHDPYAITREYWDRYDPDEIDPPTVPPIPLDRLDPHSRRIRHVCAMDQYRMTWERVRNARHAYYGAISYVDDKVGQLLRVLEATGLRDDTIVLFTSDHGDMLGERGLWYKMNFFEWSARVPLIVSAPRWFAPRRVRGPVSLLDLLPTLVDLAGGKGQIEYPDPPDGRSLVPALRGEADVEERAVLGELLAECAIAPLLMIRRGRYKFVYSEPDPDQLYDLEEDPHELHNLAGDPAYAELCEAFRAEVVERWNPEALKQEVIASQRRRRLLCQALATGRQTSWDYQPVRDAARQYIRTYMDLDDLERKARFPRVEVPAPEQESVTGSQ